MTTPKQTLPQLETLERMSADLAGPVAAWLAALTAAPADHARFLNTLSLMEHLGSRKIMASQSPQKANSPWPDQEVLKHLAEETRHAFFFKRAAEKTAGRALDYAPGDMIAGAGAAMYMGRLDAQVAKAVGGGAPSRAAYLTMSLVVELRAVWFYRLYKAALAEAGSRISLNAVLAEEELHLREMASRLEEADPEAAGRMDDLLAFEDRQFRSLWASLKGAKLAVAA